MVRQHPDLAELIVSGEQEAAKNPPFPDEKALRERPDPVRTAGFAPGLLNAGERDQQFML